jgi:hypothetical protein
MSLSCLTISLLRSYFSPVERKLTILKVAQNIEKSDKVRYAGIALHSTNLLATANPKS